MEVKLGVWKLVGGRGGDKNNEMKPSSCKWGTANNLQNRQKKPKQPSEPPPNTSSKVVKLIQKERERERLREKVGPRSKELMFHSMID